MSYRQLLELIGDAPGLKVLEVTTHADALSAALSDHVKKCGGELTIAAYPGEHTRPEHTEHLKYGEIKHFKAPFKAAARDYEVIILNDILHLHAFRERLLKHAYQGLENSAILIVLQSEGTMPREKVEAMVEACEYRAVNTIDSLVAGCQATVAKKLHMWGNGM
jgi:hypothetical protein